jgi:hypothetical protein
MATVLVEPGGLMAGKDVTIRAQALDGTWQTIGGESARGVFPEGVALEADQWGSSVASFDLRRDPRAFWPDITAFTPIEVYVGSSLVWSGRVKETPSQVAQRVMNVQCEGWQFHLDDDIYQRTYVHADLTAWKNAQSLLSSDLTRFTTVGSVGTGAAITIGWAKGGVISTNNCVGVTLDLATPCARRVVVDYERIGGQNDTRLFCLGHNAPDVFAGSDGFFSTPSLDTEPAAGSYTGDSTDPVRYITIYIIYTGAGGTFGADITERLTGIRVFTDTSYESAGVSTLKASTVVRDALSRATLLLSSDLTGITDTSFAMPSYNPDRQTARQAWSSVDAYHDWLKKIDVDRRPIYQAKPSRPIFEVGAWSAINDDDASANSGAEIYNRVDVGFTGPSGAPSVEERFHGQDGTGNFSATDALPFLNPSFDADTIEWSNGGLGTLTRTTTAGEFDTTPAAGKLTVSSGLAGHRGSALTNLVGTAARGRVYRITARIRTDAHPANPFDNPTVTIGAGNPGSTQTILPASTAGAFITVSMLWRPEADVLNPVIVVEAVSDSTHSSVVWIDSLKCEASAASLVDRHGFTRAMSLPVQSTLPDDGIAADAIGDVWLAAHRTTPFRGGVTLVGDESVREILTGRPVGLETLLLNTTELMRFSDRTDPDTAGQGRDGRMAQVSYTPATDTAVVTIDNSRTSFEALAARLAVIQGG